ncbi:30S ribosomal protein S4 [Candidatus Parcubacteria bacterium]|nr:30S ribosomal protein S4 [Patescibacteria group bacterium]MCG2688268.1 30S ribosomal protein S4 [Candidatus Parcubacteria bacterium]
MPLDAKCKVCRRQEAKLFLRGERCFSPKCAMVKRPYAPGLKGKRRKRAPSQYAKELKEKQKLKFWYGLGEKQFKRYVKEILEKSRKRKQGEAEDATILLVKKLESRLDNVIFRIGLVNSRALAKQLVSHGYFKVNGHCVDIPSYQVKINDVINIREEKLKKKIFQNLKASLKKQKALEWLQINPETLEVKIISDPVVSIDSLPAEIASIFEFYSR